MAGYSFNSGNTIFTSNTSQTTFNGLNVENRLVFGTDPETLGGETAAYTSGGGTPASVNTVDKFTFASEGTAADAGDLSVARAGPSGQSSSTHGYTAGGYEGPYSNVVDKFPFSTFTTASDVGDLSVTKNQNTGQSSFVNGYSSGGFTGPGDATVKAIDIIPFSVDENTVQVASLTQSRGGGAGSSSPVSGYTAGGTENPPGYTLRNTIDKFPFAAESAASTDVGDMISARGNVAGNSSETHGYASGGNTPGFSNIIEKFPFAADTSSAGVGDLTNTRRSAVGQSSKTNGYVSGGFVPSGPPDVVTSNVERFSFATDTGGSTIGALSQARRLSAGQQD